METYIGKSVNKKHLKEAEELIEPKEKFLGIFHGGIEDETGRSRGMSFHDYLIVTDKRVIFWGRGLVSRNSETFYYKDINSIQELRGVLRGGIEINVHGARERMGAMIKTDVPIAKKMIMEKLNNKEKTPKETHIGKDPVEQLEKLSKMYKDGLISKEEYEKMKKKIL